MSAKELKRLERHGYVDARIKEDAGCTRVTVRLLNSFWRSTFDPGGTLIAEEKW